MLSIPYYRPTFDGSELVATLRFRCLEKHEHNGHGKYNSLPGDRSRMFNTAALVTDRRHIAVCEGEMDCITAEVCGIPAIGIPGAASWNKAFRNWFLGYDAVYVLADGDDPGRRMGTALRKDLDNIRLVHMPDGSDVNDCYMKYGPEYLRERIN